MTKMLQGVSCHPLTPHLIKLIVTCIRLGKKKEKKSDNKVTFVFHPFFFALFENHANAFRYVTWRSPCEHQLAFLTAVLSQAHSSASLWNLLFTQSQLV